MKKWVEGFEVVVDCCFWNVKYCHKTKHEALLHYQTFGNMYIFYFLEVLRL